MQTMGLNHVVMTVSDVVRAKAFYGDLLGFDVNVMEEDPDQSFYFAAGDLYFFFFPSRNPIEGDRFSEFRVGLDHISFNAPSREALDDLAQRLIMAGVDTQGVEQFAPTGNYYVAFRDPDNIQLEYWLP